MRRFVLIVWLALATIHVALGITWVAQNFNAVPDYGDTGDYLQLARTLEVDAYRGIAYPAFIAALDRVPGGAGLLRPAARSSWNVKAGVIYLQSIQLLASLAALAYFLRVLAAPVVPRAERRWIARGGALLLLLLLFFDPLVAHFNLSIMTDGLALSGSLAFCAALAEFGLGSSRRWLPGIVLALAFVLVSTLRPEKLLVLACATIATLAGWLWLQRRLPRDERLLSPARAAQALALVLVCGAAVLALQRSTQVDGKRWPIADSIVHARIVFPNVTAVYDELPEDVRARMSLRDAKRHDAHSIQAFRVINDVTGASGPRRPRDRGAAADERPSADRVRHEMLREIAAVVVHERWPLLAADLLKDVVENTASTLSFYVRLAVLAARGEVSAADGTQKTYEVLSAIHPRSSRLYVISSVVLVLASAALAVAALLLRRRSGRRLERRALARWLPVAAFVLANAFAFALRADMVHIRYMLLAHAAFAALALRGALDWLAAGARPASGGDAPAAA